MVICKILGGKHPCPSDDLIFIMVGIQHSLVDDGHEVSKCECKTWVLSGEFAVAVLKT